MFGIEKIDTSKFDKQIRELLKDSGTTKDEKISTDTKIKNINWERYKYLIVSYIKHFLLYILFFLLVTVNFIAVAISLSCSRKSPIFKRVISGLYAFLFGIIYIIINYKYYRLTINSDKSGIICPDNPFAI